MPRPLAKVWLAARFVFCVVLLVPSPAYAYIDPGAGSLILQALLAGVFAAGFFIKTYFHKIKKFFGGNKESSSDSSSSSDDKQDE
jgi:hypothetical protein